MKDKINLVGVLMNDFLKLEHESDRLMIESDYFQDELIGDMYWDDYTNTKNKIYIKIKDLFKNNKPDDLADYVHDSILSDGYKFPSGYNCTVICSIYSAILKCYKTIAIVFYGDTHYFVEVNMLHKVSIGTSYASV